MRLFGIAGWQGSGKTTLITSVVGKLVRRGHTVSTVKHAHHAFDIDHPGKDSHRHRQAGAREVLVMSANRWALMHELRGAPEPSLGELVAKMSAVDLVLVEGFKQLPFDKLEVHRVGSGKALLATDDSSVVAVAADAPIAGLHVPVLDRDDITGITELIALHCGLVPAREQAV